ncbi:MAG: OsmC family peroxiredoxin [Acidimicrobiia bacterium]
MPVRTAQASWEGSVTDGKGTITSESGTVDAANTLAMRTDEGVSATNPEELIASAHAGCYSMMLSALLTKAGSPPERIDTSARIHLAVSQSGLRITKSELTTRARVPGLDDAAFQQIAEEAKKACPVSVALAGLDEITLQATLES